MPPKSRVITLPAVSTPMVLTIACPAALRERVARATGSLGALIKHCTMPQAPDAVATRRPPAIVIPQHVYDFDPAEFEALARDVSASLVRVDDDIGVEVLEMLLGAAIEAGLARRRKQGAVIVAPDDPRAAPPSRRATPPAWRRSSPELPGPPSSQG